MRTIPLYILILLRAATIGAADCRVITHDTIIDSNVRILGINSTAIPISFAMRNSAVAYGNINLFDKYTATISVIGIQRVFTILDDAVIEYAVIEGTGLKTDTAPFMFLDRILSCELDAVAFRSFCIECAHNSPGMMTIV